MSANTDSGDTSPSNAPTAAQTDLTDYLSERSELPVYWESVEEPEQRLSGKPVARVSADGPKASVSDFPSGKPDEGGNFSRKTFLRYRDVVADFLETQDVADLQEVTPADINRYRQVMQRRDYARTTRDGRLETLAVFFKWAEKEWRAPRGDDKISDVIDAKRNDLGVDGTEKSRAGEDAHRISRERAEEILGDLAEFQYASREMVEFLLIYHVGFRKSGIRSINCDDVKPDRGVIEVRNRPKERGVRLKRGDESERDVNVSSGVMKAVERYIENNRTDPESGSDALLSTHYGRVDDTTLYRDIADLTRCGECTDEDGDELVKQNAADCPKSIGPHDLRRTAITRMRDEGITWETIGGRVNATPDILKDHYDSPTHEEAAERRREEVLRHL